MLNYVLGFQKDHLLHTPFDSVKWEVCYSIGNRVLYDKQMLVFLHNFINIMLFLKQNFDIISLGTFNKLGATFIILMIGGDAYE